MSKKYLAIFDLDGTLFDTGDVNYHAYKQALEEEGVGLTREDYLDKYNGRHYTDFLPEILPDNETVERVHERKKLLYTENLFRAKENLHLFNMIEALSPDYHIALVTTANKKNATEILENFGRADTFEYILTGEDLTKVKPDPAGFLMAMEHFGVSAENTVIYEDSATGLAAAMASGAAVMAVKFF